MAQAQTEALITCPFPNVAEMPVSWWLDKKSRLAENHKAIVDLNTGKLYSIVSMDYRVIRHEDAIKEVEQELSGMKGLGQYEAITEFFNDGGRMRRTYRFNDIAVKIKNEGDLINPELHLFNSYDKTWPFIILLGAFRLVCENGLVVGNKFLHLRKRHIYELGQIDVAEEVGTALKRFNKQARQWKSWTKKKVTPRSYSKVLETMKLGIKAKEVVENRVMQETEDFDTGGFPVITAWGFYNILTRYISHNAVSLNHRVAMESRLRAASVHLMR
jgi:hypothetical protein